MENNRWIGVHSPECLPWLCNVNNFAGNFFLKKTSEDTMTYYPVTIPSMWRGSPRLHHGNGIRRHSAYEQRKQRGEWSPVWVRNWGCMSSHPVSSIACYFWISWFVQPFLARTANIPTKMHSASNVCNFCFIYVLFCRLIWVGAGCAIVGNLFISLSFQLQRLAHKNNTAGIVYCTCTYQRKESI